MIRERKKKPPVQYSLYGGDGNGGSKKRGINKNCSESVSALHTNGTSRTHQQMEKKKQKKKNQTLSETCALAAHKCALRR